MIYPSDFEEKIGFASLRHLLSQLCLSVPGKKRIESMQFSPDFEHIETMLRETSEMLAIVQKGLDLPTDNLHDVAGFLLTAKTPGSFLSGADVFKLRNFLSTLIAIHAFFSAGSSENEGYPYLKKHFEHMPILPNVVAEIDRVINKFGEVKDDASPRLYELRKSLNSATAAMSSVMRRVISSAVAQGIIEKDTVPAMRDGRLVIPVSAMSKRQIPGIIHDESASGKTAYIEPSEVVAASNRIREIEMEIRREEIIILTALTASIRPYFDDIMYGAEMAADFDFIRAKALLAQEVGGQLPVLHKAPGIEWYNAFHPGLALTLRKQNRSVVPLTLRLDEKHRFLVISGPNAGGKSVALKTVGIVQYMAQCGLLPTLDSNSHVGLFRNILIDIGDEQSIENDLSTYSSHLRNMKHFLLHANRHTLLLGDEIGSGTEPQIGGALAQAILKKLNESKCYGVVTTHYQNIKKFAETEPGFVNGAMVYDRQHLRPTFQLTVGNPGSSFALEIARNTGLPKEVIDDAKEIVGSDYVNLDKYLLDIARDRKYWAEKRLKIRQQELKTEHLAEDLENRVASLKEQRSAILRDAREDARKIMEEANAKIEKAVSDIRKSQAEKEQTKEVRRQLEQYKKELKEGEKEGDLPKELRNVPKRKKNEAQHTAKSKEQTPIAVGDYVRMSDGGVVGKVLSISDKNAEVAFGALRTRVDIKRLKRANAPKPVETEATVSTVSSISDTSRQRRLNFKREIDVRGMRADEALQAVTYFLDDAHQFEAQTVRILHGTGTGALRVAIRQLLKSNPIVKDFHDEDVRFGGAGITVVNL